MSYTDAMGSGYHFPEGRAAGSSLPPARAPPSTPEKRCFQCDRKLPLVSQMKKTWEEKQRAAKR